MKSRKRDIRQARRDKELLKTAWLKDASTAKHGPVRYKPVRDKAVKPDYETRGNR